MHLLLALLLLVTCPLLTSCTKLFYQPDSYLHYPPEKLGYKPKELTFASVDGTKLIAWYFKANAPDKKTRGTIVQFHGNAENISSFYTTLVWLTKHGYNLFIFDYRGYGGSQGEPSQHGVYLDGMAALDKAWELRSGPRFIVYGQSLGGAIAMRAFHDFRHKNKTDLIVMDSTFMSYDTVARRWAASYWITWPISPLAPLLVSNKYASEDAVRKNKTRLLVIHDERDPVVPFSCGKELYEGATSTQKKDFWKLADGRHIEVFAPYNKEYRERFVRLLETL